MTILVFGTGAMATLLGAHLAKVTRVALVGTWAAALESVAANGLQVALPRPEIASGLVAGPGNRVPQAAWPETWTSRVAVHHRRDPFPPADVALVLVKSYQTAEVAPAVAAAVPRPGGLIVTLQNGLGNAAALRAARPTAPVLAGVTTSGATLIAPGVVRLGGIGHTLIEAGPRPGQTAELIALFGAAGLPVQIAEPIEPHVWRKLAVNCAVNGASAVYRVTNGELLSNPEARQLMAQLASETAAVAAAIGIAAGSAMEITELAVSVAAATAANRSSLLQDLDRGRPTEVDSLHGAVLELARAHGLDTPATASIVDLLSRSRGAPVTDAGPREQAL